MYDAAQEAAIPALEKGRQGRARGTRLALARLAPSQHDNRHRNKTKLMLRDII